MAESPVTEQIYKIRKSIPQTQDLTGILLVRYEKHADGTVDQFYAQSINWQPYRGFDLLDLSEMSVPGAITIRIEGE